MLVSANRTVVRLVTAQPAGGAELADPGLDLALQCLEPGDDPVPVAPDRVRHGQLRRPAGRPGAGPAHRAGERPVGSRTARLAAGVRDRAVGPVAGVPPGGARLARVSDDHGLLTPGQGPG